MALLPCANDGDTSQTESAKDSGHYTTHHTTATKASRPPPPLSGQEYRPIANRLGLGFGLGHNRVCVRVRCRCSRSPQVAPWTFGRSTPRLPCGGEQVLFQKSNLKVHTIWPATEMTAPIEAPFIRERYEFSRGPSLPHQARPRAQGIFVGVDVERRSKGMIA